MIGERSGLYSEYQNILSPIFNDSGCAVGITQTSIRDLYKNLLLWIGIGYRKKMIKFGERSTSYFQSGVHQNFKKCPLIQVCARRRLSCLKFAN